jgi:hypothetical protein
MHMAVTGALVGLGIGLFLLAGDYLMLRGAARERAKKQHKTVVEFDGTERSRIRSLASFCVILPPVLALAFWAIWG